MTLLSRGFLLSGLLLIGCFAGNVVAPVLFPWVMYPVAIRLGHRVTGVLTRTLMLL